MTLQNIMRKTSAAHRATELGLRGELKDKLKAYVNLVFFFQRYYGVEEHV